MFGWIPIIGPIIQGIVSMFSKHEDVVMTKVVTEGKVTVQETQSSTQIIHDTADDIGVRLTRDIIMFPVALWTSLISYDTIVIHDHPNWVFLTIEKYPPVLEFLPYAVIAFLFGNIGLNMWKRR